MIRQGQGAGEISKQHKADLLARFVINAWEGATVRMKLTQSEQALEDFFAMTFDGILAGKST